MSSMQSPPPHVLVGTSGWSYAGWRGVFYPAGLPQREWLPFYASRFSTVELNVTFYRLPPESTFELWRRNTPEGFCFALKASRLITHLRRLRDVSEPLATLFEHASALGDRLGPVLYQLPPGMGLDLETLERFLKLLPPGRTHVLEFRDRSWYDGRAYELLRRHGAAFCIHDFKGRESPVLATSEVAYARFHGAAGRYAGGYTDTQIEGWARALCALPGVARLYAYFNNDVGGHAVNDATRLARMLGETPSTPHHGSR